MNCQPSLTLSPLSWFYLKKVTKTWFTFKFKETDGPYWVFSFIAFQLIYFYHCVFMTCVFVWACLHAEVRGQFCRCWFSPSTFTWFLGIEVKLSGLLGKCLLLLSHLDHPSTLLFGKAFHWPWSSSIWLDWLARELKNPVFLMLVLQVPAVSNFLHEY